MSDPPPPVSEPEAEATEGETEPEAVVVPADQDVEAEPMESAPDKTGTVSREVWMLESLGSIGDLKLVSQDISPPNEGEVQIATKSIGLNFADVYACKGLYQAAPKKNFTPGFEIAGVVTEVNYRDDEEKKQDDPIKAGDRVLAILEFGAYATHHNVDYRYVRKIPDDWSFPQAAAFSVQALTAYYALCILGSMEKGQAVLIHSGAGGVGLNALKICEKVGAKAVVTVGSKSKVEFLVQNAGLTEEQVIVRTNNANEFSKQLEDSLTAIDEEGFDIVCDSLLGDYFFPAYKKMRPMGRHVVLGAGYLTTQGDSPSLLKLGYRYFFRPKLDILQLIGQNKSVMGFNLVYLFSQIEKINKFYTALMDMNLSPPHVGEEFDFKDARDALRRFQTGQTVGKVVLNVSNDSAPEEADNNNKGGAEEQEG